MNKKITIKAILILLFIAIVILLPIIIKNEYWMHVFIIIAIMILATCSMRAINRTGEMSLGTAGFMLLGAYASAILTKDLGLSFWITMPLGGLFAAVVALLLGYPFFRLKGIYFVITTLMAGLIFLYLAGWSRNLTGGWQGMMFEYWPDPITIPGVITLTFDTDFSYYYLTVVIVGLSLFILYRMEHSRIGLIWGSIKEADNLAQSVGINIMAHKIFIFTVACFFTGIAGALYSFYVHALSPTVTPANIFHVNTSVFILLYMVMGGEGSFFGPIIGTILFMLIPEFSRPLQAYRPVIYGTLLILIIFFMPEGFIGLGKYLHAWFGKLKRLLPSKAV